MRTLPRSPVALARWAQAFLGVALIAATLPAASQNVFNGKQLYATKQCGICHETNPANLASDANNVLNGANRPDVINAACNLTVDAMLPHCSSTDSGGFFDAPLSVSRAEAIDIAAFLGNPNGQQALVKLSRQALKFQRSANNGASPRQRFDVINTGNGAATLVQAELQGGNTGDFQLLAPEDPQLPDCSVGRTLPPFTFCSVEITFTPGAQGDRSTQVVFAFDPDSQVGQQQIVLSGTGTANQQPFATTAVDNLNFGVLPLNATSAAQTVVITNDGDADLVFDADAFVLEGANADDFVVQDGGTCAANGRLNANGASCQLQVAFSPRNSGNRLAQIKVQSNAGDVTVQLQGVSTANSSNVGVGGCSIGGPDAPLDPLLLALCALALAVLRWRRATGRT